MNLHLLFTILLITLYVISPIKYSLVFNSLVTLIFILQCTVFFKKVSKGNFINFYTFFFISFYFVNFFYPTIIYPLDPEYFSTFRRTFDHDVINVSTALAGVAASCLMYGASLQKLKPQNKIYMPLVFNHNYVTILGVVLFFIFISIVGKDFLAGAFNSQSVASAYILPLVSSAFILSSIIFYRDYKYQTKKMFFYFSIMFYMLFFLLIGDRGPALYIGLAILALYSRYVKSLKPILVPPLIIFGMLLMSIVGVGRKIEESNGNVFVRGFKDFEFNLDGFYESTFDLTANAWTLYIGYGHAQENGINWGSTVFLYILSIIPFAQSFIESTFNIKLISSSLLFSEIALGPNRTWGVGTNLISSVYIAFGFVGVIITFIIMGSIIERYRLKLFYKNTIWANIIYFTFISISIYYPRAEVLTPFKTIIWTYIVYILLRNTNILKPLRLRIP